MSTVGNAIMNAFDASMWRAIGNAIETGSRQDEKTTVNERTSKAIESESNTHPMPVYKPITQR